jgi:ring-1,2-phenylacetyl-CoA epoxidase subunit PaaD
MVMTTTTSIQTQEIWAILKEVPDPEVPVLSVTDLSIIRNVSLAQDINGNDVVEITITPTYTGCPAMDVISMNIRFRLIEHGYKNVQIKTVLSPAWTTDWMSEEGKQKLKSYGIAPPNPGQQVCQPDLFAEDESVQCPRCNSYHTSMVSRFGSTACKALYKCDDCHEPFDYFKCH